MQRAEGFVLERALYSYYCKLTWSGYWSGSWMSFSKLFITAIAVQSAWLRMVGLIIRVTDLIIIVKKTSVRSSSNSSASQMP